MKMNSTKRSLLQKHTKNSDFFGGKIDWQKREKKELTMAITKNLHGFVRNMLSNDYVLQMKKSYINKVKNQVTCGTSDDVYYGRNFGDVEEDHRKVTTTMIKQDLRK